MENFLFPEELDSALHAENEGEQFKYITKIESMFLKQNSFEKNDLTNILTILSAYLVKNSKKIRQRSLALILSLCKFEIPEKISKELIENVVLCFLDSRANIRQYTLKVCNNLSITSTTSISPQLFVPSISKNTDSFPLEARPLILDFLLLHKSSFNVDDWSLLSPIILLCLDDKPSVKTAATEIVRDETFLNGLQNAYLSLSPQLKKIANQYLEKKVSPNLPNDNPTNAENSDIDSSPSKETEIDNNILTLNTSPFSRQRRQSEMNSEDGIHLLTEPSFLNQFISQLSLDIRDVFDDDIADKLLSKLSSERLGAVNLLKNIFLYPQNFECSIDLIFRWCGLQFIGRHLNVAQAALSLLLDQFNNDSNENSPRFLISAIELDFIVPIVLWCIATTSTAYNDLLSVLRSNSNSSDYANSLLLSLQLHHTVIISAVFNELSHMTDINGVEIRLKEAAESDVQIIREKANAILFRLSPASPKSGKSKISSSDQLKSLIQKIKSQPSNLGDGANVFQILREQVEKYPTDDQTIRYLLYGLYSFFSEPILTSVSLNQQDLISFVRTLCDFASSIGPKYSDPLNAIGFVFSILVEPLPLFQELINYIDDHYDSVSPQSFEYKLFEIAISLLSVHQRELRNSDLTALRNFGRMIGNRKDINNHKENDLRWLLAKSLLSEIVTFEQTKHEDQLNSSGLLDDDSSSIGSGYGAYSRREMDTPKRTLITESPSNSIRQSTPKSSAKKLYARPSSKVEKSGKKSIDNDSDTISIDLLEKLARPSSRADAIQQLINEDKTNVLNIIAAMDIKFLQRECDQAKRLRSSKRRGNIYN